LAGNLDEMWNITEYFEVWSYKFCVNNNEIKKDWLRQTQIQSSIQTSEKVRAVIQREREREREESYRFFTLRSKRIKIRVVMKL
jgi:hypothetical protein